ncbi:hypothetical protein LAJ19_05060 [Deinococcus taeanensis]|uniref:hypothetical protein n=1 Tax=Deinococcus taeanensis TaxID=2737050 RepID=UPI001CDD6411|nr:hypothetical protein [Deinococcus taeanensis]UBV43587.1 hypothetical protein LAJ19_05060 [Deinococcus taeanensis]
MVSPTSASRPRPALARPLDLTYPSNRAAALGTLATVAVARARGRPWPDALGTGAAAFLAWATARELDPDHPVTANAALAVAAAATLPDRPVGLRPLLGAVAVLSGLRLTAGTTGQSTTRTDLVALLTQALLAAGTGAPVAAAVAGAAPLLTPQDRSAVPLMGALLPAFTHAHAGSWRGALLSAAALPLAGTLTAPEAVGSACDRAPRTVRAAEVQRTRQVAVLALAAGLVARQSRGLLPLAAACLTVAARRAGADLKTE